MRVGVKVVWGVISGILGEVHGNAWGDLLYPANFKLDKGHPKEKAGPFGLKSAPNGLQQTPFGPHALINRSSLKPQSLPPPPLLPSPTSIPETHAALPNVVPPPPTFGDLLSCIMDSPSHGASTPHKRPPPEHDIALRGSKRPRIDSLNTFMRSHQPNIPEIFDVSMTRSLVY
ncbi:hypothetical protein C8R41DRAFT_921381 [Lentinula lateritia]|uniref:Uncharacterized protein n=1 Tax=Lentinula lateritia TaxID=40482 RepID=A0ABQ8VEB2_9AGAR|nr:hypothetical protein C8R41DRAFT_921381 [Lentinula lateritia]